MSLTHFICPDKKTIKIEDCLAKCRHESQRLRCPHISMLRNMAARRRAWIGVPSTTQLINGTRQAMLEIQNDYAISPHDLVFAEHGSAFHSNIEQDTDRIMAHGITGLPDWYEDGDLIDFKVTGSFKLAAIRGLVEKESPDEAVLDWKLQLNQYRLLLKAQGKTVKRMFIHAILRDFNTIMSRKYGFTEPAIWIPIDFMDDEEVKAYFITKKAALHKALEQGYALKCTAHENWNGRKCKSYCAVADLCRKIGE